MRRPTPETDAERREGLIRGIAIPTHVVSAEFAEELERQRDEVREALQISIESFKEMQAATWRTAGELRGMARKGLDKIKLKEGREMSDRPKWYNGREIPTEIKEEAK
jgi:hypothetical protein